MILCCNEDFAVLPDGIAPGESFAVGLNLSPAISPGGTLATATWSAPEGQSSGVTGIGNTPMPPVAVVTLTASATASVGDVFYFVCTWTATTNLLTPPNNVEGPLIRTLAVAVKPK